jgi:hypothetical protein
LRRVIGKIFLSLMAPEQINFCFDPTLLFPIFWYESNTTYLYRLTVVLQDYRSCT